MKTIVFIFCISLLVLIINCKKDDEVKQTFDYYDFHDIVLKYPTDTTKKDSVIFGLTSGSVSDFKIASNKNTIIDKSNLCVSLHPLGKIIDWYI